MFDRILAPLDGAALSECVLPHLISLSRVFNAQVTLVQVLDCPTGTATKPVDPLDWEIKKAEAESYLDNISAQLKESGLDKVTTALLEGQPAQRLIEYIQSEDFDLVVLSSHGGTGLSQWNVSSVVRKVVQRANRSVMLVRAYKASKSETLEHARYDRMFVPLDGSKRAEYALNTAVALSRFFDAKLVLGHVIARPEMPLQIPLTDDDRGLIERYVDRVKEAITKYFGSLQARSLIEFESRLRVNDDIAASLHDMVEAERTDMVVLCAHGYSGKRKWPFGGVTTSFIEYGTTPLLMIQDLRPDEVELTEAEKAAEETKGH